MNEEVKAHTSQSRWNDGCTDGHTLNQTHLPVEKCSDHLKQTKQYHNSRDC